MQLGTFKNFIQRSKFYTFHKFNTLVAKGKFQFENLNKIYCIGFLANNLFPYANYYHFGVLRNQRGEVMDDQMFHIIVEISKFNLKEEALRTDLEKLIYTRRRRVSSVSRILE